jgi:hypothetical protein
MKLFSTMSPAEQQAVQRFYNGFQNAPTTIAFRSQFIERKADNSVGFMPIISDPVKRIVMKEGDTARMHNVHPIETKQHLNSLFLLIGTPYGLLVVYGRENEYKINGKNVVLGPLPQLHHTARFLGAALRFFARTKRGKTTTAELVTWIFSDNFERDLEEQAQLDYVTEQKTGNTNLLGDGMPPRIRQQHPTQKKAYDVSKRRGPIQPVADFQNPKEVQPHPLDIIPCRANGFKGTRYADQTPEQRAEGAAMVVQPGVLSGVHPAV